MINWDGWPNLTLFEPKLQQPFGNGFSLLGAILVPAKREEVLL